MGVFNGMYMYFNIMNLYDISRTLEERIILVFKFAIKLVGRGIRLHVFLDQLMVHSLISL